MTQLFAFARALARCLAGCIALSLPGPLILPQGGSLSSCLANQMAMPFASAGVFSPVHGLDWLCQVASAVKYLQAQAPLIMHRDM